MARRLYGVTDEVLLEYRAKAQLEKLRGSKLISFGDGSSSSSQQMVRTPDSVIDEINAELRERGHPLAPAAETTPDNFVTVSFSRG